jgi:hypothetical protein
MTFRPAYALAALATFAIEVLIALFVRDTFIRPYVGDMLAVVLVYAALRSATPLRQTSAIVVTLAIAFAIEFAQVFDVVEKLGLGGSQLARIVFGGAFDVLDLVAYAAGAMLVLAVEAMRRPGNSP